MMDEGHPPPKKKKIVLVMFHFALFFLFNLLIFVAGTDGLSRNIGMELPLYGT